MAAISSNGTGGGKWSQTTTWAGGVVPGGADDVTIVAGDTVDADIVFGSSGAPNCNTLVIDGILQIFNTYGVYVAGAVSGNGEYQVNGGGTFSPGAMSTNNLHAKVKGTSHTNRATFVKRGSGQYRFYGRGRANSGQEWEWFDFVGDPGGASQFALLIYNFEGDLGDYVRDGLIHGISATGIRLALNNETLEADRLNVYDCQRAVAGGGVGSRTIIRDSVFGREFDGTLNANASSDLQFRYPGCDVRCYGVECASPVVMQTASGAPAATIYATGWDGTPGSALLTRGYVIFTRDVLAKKSGAAGIDCLPTQHLDRDGTADGFVDLLFPIESGVAVVPSLELQIVSPSADFAGAGDDIELELDPGNEWGLREKLFPTYATEDAWQTITFTGGTPGGTGKKGLCAIRVRIRKYVAESRVYLADLSEDDGDFDQSVETGWIATKASGGGGLKGPVVGSPVVKGVS